MKKTIGIDPGRHGALTIVEPTIEKTPKVVYNLGYKLQPDSYSRLQTLQQIFSILPIKPECGCIEHPVLIYKMVRGIRSVRNQKAYDTQLRDMNQIKDLCQLFFDIDLQEIYPPTWKSFFKIISNGTGKQQSIFKASQYYPVSNDHEADSVLIAVYGFFHFGVVPEDLTNDRSRNESEKVKKWRDNFSQDLISKFGADPLILTRKGR